jgi:hypothetical protein
MNKKQVYPAISDEVITNKIYLLRGQKIMLDRDLAELFEVETKVLKQAVKRNIDIFPEHFMFEMTEEEFNNWRSQFVTSNSDKMGLRYKPFCFTEHGVLQIANVLKSGKARQMSIRIIEIFVKMREILTSNIELRLEIEHIKKKVDNHGKNIELVFQYLDELLEKKENPQPRKQIGFILP